MNKYSKRALKTTATVGMSLAMVLSGVAAPVVKVDAATVVVCTIANKAQAQLIIDSIKADLKTAGYTLDTIPADAVNNKVLVNDATKDKIQWANTIAVAKLNDVTAGMDIKTVLGKISLTLDPATFTEVMTGCAGDLDDAKKLAGFTAAKTVKESLAAYNQAMTDLTTALGTDKALSDSVITKTEWEASVKTLYEAVLKSEGYKDNVILAAADNKATNKQNIADFKEMVEDYTNTYVNEFVKDYTTALKGYKIKDVTVEALVDDAAAFPRANLDALETAIKEIKEDKIDALTNSGVTYAQVGTEDEVTDYIDGLEAIVDEIKEANDLLKSNSAAQKALKEVKTEVSDLVTAIKNAANLSGDALETEIEKRMNAFRTKELENITTYVEDLFNEFYTVTVKQRANGNYSVDVEGTSYARYLNDADKTAFATANGVGYLVSTLVEKDVEETYYEALVGNVNDAEKLINAVKAIDGIRIGTTFTSADAAKIVAARNAYTELTADGNPYGLTAKELRTVKSYNTTIETLYTKLLLTGTITESGWIDKGAGNWDYIDADGSKSTKWVAAGKDWYFVQNGTMLRSAWIAQDSTGAKWYYVDNAGKMVSNTTIDGFVIDANGVWTK